MNRDPVPPTSDLEVLLIDVVDPQLPIRCRVGCPGGLIAGRDPTSDLQLPAADHHAGRTHFRIDLRPTFCRLKNESTKGTFLNGTMILSDCDLRHGDLIRAGHSAFLVELRRKGAPAELPPSPTMSPRLFGDTTSPTGGQPSAAPVIVPMQLPGYRLLRSLGAGGMGTVWLAEDGRGQPVACKVIRPELALDPDTCQRFRRETNHLRDLSHRHVVGFREAGEFHGLLFLVMDYVPGSSLADLLRQQGRFGVSRAVRLACQILEALGAAHGNGVVHRDVKPSNVLVQQCPGGEEARLADFGLAKAYQLADVGQELTVTGVMGGTLAFAAPEMLTDFRSAGPLADQYGAAATLYNLLTAQYLHDTSDAHQMLSWIRTRDAVPLSQRRSEIPAALAAVIHRALRREPRLRFPTVHVLRQELLPFAG